MTPHAIARLLEQTARAVYRAPERSALHPGQWAVLRYLMSAGVLARTVNGVARYLETTHGTASRAVQALEAKGLVERAPHPDDGRSHIIDVTATGRAMLEGDPVEVLAEAIEALPHEVRATFVEGLQFAYDHVKTAGPVNGSRRDPGGRSNLEDAADAAHSEKDSPLASILVVEDDKTVGEAFTRALIATGYDVRLCASAADAHRALDERAFDLILLDLWLPVTSGLDFMKALAERPVRPKVVTISGGGPGRSLENALTISQLHGATTALVKPVTDDELVDAVKSALDA